MADTPAEADTPVSFVDADATVPPIVDATAPVPAGEPSTFTPLDVRALRINARPLICADCSSDKLISRFSMLPFVDLITAGG